MLSNLNVGLVDQKMPQGAFNLDLLPQIECNIEISYRKRSLNVV